jgi:hypothetical protein
VKQTNNTATMPTHNIHPSAPNRIGTIRSGSVVDSSIIGELTLVVVVVIVCAGGVVVAVVEISLEVDVESIVVSSFFVVVEEMIDCETNEVEVEIIVGVTLVVVIVFVVGEALVDDGVVVVVVVVVVDVGVDNIVVVVEVVVVGGTIKLRHSISIRSPQSLSNALNANRSNTPFMFNNV